jgi:ATP/maltotriose-dependent transcriptional regulator MalT
MLAGLEVAAISGSQSRAADWLSWVAARVPVDVRTSLEWPVCIDRLLGLLGVRAGDLKGGIAALRRAIRWCDSTGYEIEAKIARLQLAEVLEHSATTVRRGELAELRDGSWSGLSALGIDPTRQAYVATRAIALSQELGQPRLTRREAEVLALLAEGMTYRAAALPLGISWRTVQLHAHRAYAKLGANGRMQALSIARAEHIL